MAETCNGARRPACCSLVRAACYDGRPRLSGAPSVTSELCADRRGRGAKISQSDLRDQDVRVSGRVMLDARYFRGVIMIETSDFRIVRMPLNHGAGYMPVLGFGTLIPDAAVTISATRDALEAGFRHIDCAERYQNEREVGEALQAGLAAGGIAREDIFVTTKLWNTNHRPERVEQAFEGESGQTQAQLS